MKNEQRKIKGVSNEMKSYLKRIKFAKDEMPEINF